MSLKPGTTWTVTSTTAFHFDCFDPDRGLFFVERGTIILVLGSAFKHPRYPRRMQGLYLCLIDGHLIRDSFDDQLVLELLVKV